jgi:hypothetical protein
MSDTHITVCITILSIFTGAILGARLMGDFMQREAIEHNAAHYDSKTAEFTWNKESVKP